MSVSFVSVPGWPAPKGYRDGALCRGPVLFIAGQIGWDAEHKLAAGMVDQFARALGNVLAVVAAAGGRPEDIAKMTVFVTNLDAYRRETSAIGAAWRALLGKHFPAMALVGVAELLEPGALVEIEAVAVLEQEGP